MRDVAGEQVTVPVFTHWPVLGSSAFSRFFRVFSRLFLLTNEAIRDTHRR